MQTATTNLTVLQMFEITSLQGAGGKALDVSHFGSGNYEYKGEGNYKLALYGSW